MDVSEEGVAKGVSVEGVAKGRAKWAELSTGAAVQSVARTTLAQSLKKAAKTKRSGKIRTTAQNSKAGTER